MKRALLATLAATALALSPATVRPASAEGGGELLGLLLGIGTVYAIGKGIEQARTSDAAPAQIAPQTVDWRRGQEEVDPGYRWTIPQRTVPRDCLSTFDTWHGEIRGFSASCLARTMARPDRLPSLCAIDTRIRQHDARIYSARCLQLEGWEIGRRTDASWDNIPRPPREYMPWPGDK
jgi:hypothetical protein